MKRQINISVRVETAESPSRANNIAQEMLLEISQSLEKYLSCGERGLIDLRLRADGHSADVFEPLKDLLGRGEISARLEVQGHVEFYETKFNGVWWVAYFDDEGELETVQIEIGRVPLLLQTQKEDMKLGLVRLQKELEQIKQASSVMN